MKKEIYIWTAVIVVILAVALYFRYFYQPLLSVALSIGGGSTAHLYPYQKATFDINVFNNGSSAIANLSLGVIVNGNLSTLYKVTLPAGKQTTITYNYSPTKAGNYSISVVADPGKLYNLADRSKTQVNASISVIAAENATPSELLPKQNMTSSRQAFLTNGAYLLGTYLFDQFNVSSFRLTGNGQIDVFLKPVLNLTSYYIRNISVAEANYSGNASVYSIWIKGYLSPNIFSAATIGSSLSTTNVSTKEGTATFIKMLNDTTFCSWYSGGWLKILAEQNTSACYSLINASSENSSAVQIQGLQGKFGSEAKIENATLLGNYSFSGTGGDYLAGLSLITNSSFIYDTISNLSGARNSTCYGVVSSLNGTSFCSTYLFPKSGQIGGISLIRTTAYRGAWNLTAYSLVNTSIVLAQVESAAEILGKFNVSGTSLVFTSGLVNSCMFNESFVCSDMRYANGVASFRITNNMSSEARLNSIKCYSTASAISFPLNVTLASGAGTNISSSCYNIATKLNGTTLNLHLGLTLNYTVMNSTRLLTGSAFIPLG